MPVHVFNAAVPVELQLTDFSCAVGATFWFLRSGSATGYWVGVRGFDGTQLLLANPGGTGPNFGAKLRRQPDSSGALIKLVADATLVNGADHAWRHVTTADGTAGWMANEFLIAQA